MSDPRDGPEGRDPSDEARSSAREPDGREPDWVTEIRRLRRARGDRLRRVFDRFDEEQEER